MSTASTAAAKAGGAFHRHARRPLCSASGAHGQGFASNESCRLRVLVCSGRLCLHSARTVIQRDRRAAYGEYVAPKLPRDRTNGG